MSDDGFFGNMPYLATMPSCQLYLRPWGGSGLATFHDTTGKNTVTPSGSAANSSTVTMFPPCSIYLNNSSGYLTLSTSSNWVYGSNWACSVLFYLGTANLVTHIMGTRSGDTTSTTGWNIETISSNGNISFQWFNTSNASMSTIYGGTYTSGAFNHVFVSISSTGVATLYLNGSSIGTATPGNQTIQTPGNIHLGYAPGDTTYSNFTGYVDEVAIWSGNIVPTVTQSYAAAKNRRLIVG